MKLRELLKAMSPEDPLPDEVDSWQDIRPNTVYKILLCFMCEEETWIVTYREHPMLIPWYDCKVIGFNPDEEFVLHVWLAFEDYVPKLLHKEPEHLKETHIKWIDVNNRLPEPPRAGMIYSHHVLIAVQQGDAPTAVFEGCYRYPTSDSDPYAGWAFVDRGKLVNGNVTHWAPWPEPPEELRDEMD